MNGRTLVHSRILAPCIAFMLWLQAALLFAGGGPTGYVVVYNPNDVRSVTIANAYQRARGIPEQNMFPYVFPSAFAMANAWDFLESLRSFSEATGLQPQLQGVALAGTMPLGVGGFSLQSLIYISPSYGEATYVQSNDSQQAAFAEPSLFYGGPLAGTIALHPNNPVNGFRYLPVSLVGTPGGSGNSIPEIMEFIERWSQRDGVKSGGTIYWPLNNDVRSNSRQNQILEVGPIWNMRGINFQITGNRSTALAASNVLNDRPDVSGGVMGTATFSVRGNTFLPGSWVDHFTSTAGVLEGYTGQTVISEWLRAGADGSSGAYAEPLADFRKFPHAHIHTHLRAGASLAEAFWQSIRQPSEVLALGDPLLQPWADIPQVTISAPAADSEVRGVVEVLSTANPVGGKVLETTTELFVNGRRFMTSQNGSFPLDTTQLSDGWHELRVVAYNADQVRTQGEARKAIQINNQGQSLQVTGPAQVNPDQAVNFTIQAIGLSSASSIRLQSNGRNLGTVGVGGGVVTVPIGAIPLDGEWSVQAVAVLPNGREVWSPPFTTEVNWPPQPALENPSLGVDLADVSYYDSTTVAGFDWATTEPTARSSVAYSTNGLRIQRDNIPGVTLGPVAARPGYKLNFWFYAPTEDMYELTFVVDGGHMTNPQCLVNGVLLQANGNFFTPVKLSAGWHAVEMRFAVINQNFSGTTIRARGGFVQRFWPVNALNVASMTTNTSGTTPQLSPTFPGSAISGTTVSLNAGVTIPGGSPEELAAVRLHWGTLSGPSQATGPAGWSFNPNNGTGNFSTTGTFMETSDYVIGVRAVGTGGSSFAKFPVSVVSGGPAGITLFATGEHVLRGQWTELSAFTRDQFGRRVTVVGTNPDQPSIAWTSSEPGTFELLEPSGERVRFRSSSTATTLDARTFTATGTNGRTGSASASITFRPNNIPNPSVLTGLAFEAQQPDHNLPLQLTVTSGDFNATNTTSYPVRDWVTFAWSVDGAPAGQTATFSSTTGTTTSVQFSGSGTYGIRLTVTDTAGGGFSQTRQVTVDANGVTSFLETDSSPVNASVFVGETATFAISSAFEGPWQWQTRANSTASWVDLPSQTSTSFIYGPAVEADDGRQFRIVRKGLSGEVPSKPATLTVPINNGGVVNIKDAIENNRQRLQFGEDEGAFSVTLTRYGRTTGTATVSWSISGGLPGTNYLGLNGTTTYSGTVTWQSGQSGDRVLVFPILKNGNADSANVTFSMTSSSGAVRGNFRSLDIQLVDGEGPGMAVFNQTLATISENGGSLILSLKRRFGKDVPLSVIVSTASDPSAVRPATPGEDYAPVFETLSWAAGDTSTRQVVIPILRDSIVEGNETFRVVVQSTSGTEFSECLVTIEDPPFQNWQRQWWSGSLPQVDRFSDYRSAVRAMLPLLYLPMDESTPELMAYGPDLTTVTTSANLTARGSGTFQLGVAGPGGSAWPGLSSDNRAIRFNGTGGSSTFSGGANLNLGTAGGLGPRLADGLTISFFVRTSVTDKIMTVLEGLQSGTNTQLTVSLNRSTRVSTATPHSLSFVLRKEIGSSNRVDVSVPLQALPTGSLCDGQWHHVAITFPPLLNLGLGFNYPRIYFDGQEIPPELQRGTYTLFGGAVFADFTTAGLRIGSNGGTTAGSFFNGDLDEIAIFPKMLSAVEIGALVSARPLADPPPFVAPLASPNSDGVSNLMRYALGLSPFESATSSLPRLEMDGVNARFSFTRLRDAWDVEYLVEGSRTLAFDSWTPVWTSSAHPFPAADASITEMLDFNLTSEPRYFLRLKVREK